MFHYRDVAVGVRDSLGARSLPSLTGTSLARRFFLLLFRTRVLTSRVLCESCWEVLLRGGVCAVSMRVRMAAVDLLFGSNEIFSLAHLGDTGGANHRYAAMCGGGSRVVGGVRLQ